MPFILINMYYVIYVYMLFDIDFRMCRYPYLNSDPVLGFIGTVPVVRTGLIRQGHSGGASGLQCSTS